MKMVNNFHGRKSKVYERVLLNNDFVLGNHVPKSYSVVDPDFHQ